MTAKLASVLFACTSNVIRSPMAEGIAKRLFGTRLFVDSAGVARGIVDPLVVEVMDEIGVSLARHRPKTFDDLEDTSFDLIVTLSAPAQHRAMEMTRVWACEVEFWNTFDPSAVEGTRDMRLDAYRAVRDILMRRIRERFGVSAAPVV